MSIKNQLSERQKLQDKLNELDASIAENAGKELASIFADAAQVLKAVPADKQLGILTKSPVKEAIRELHLFVKLDGASSPAKAIDPNRDQKSKEDTYAYAKANSPITRTELAEWSNRSSITISEWLKDEPFKGKFDETRDAKNKKRKLLTVK